MFRINNHKSAKRIDGPRGENGAGSDGNHMTEG